ncbi:probable 2-oxoglutarate-dependent dioxygenase AOP1 [Cajanus cajan]|uniref:probable 2-oxoglutarate-dependent dioxygenase AOP1 n=1 Tax=Cajanus cajan TaxID=3821 RepID=UPI00098DB41E|nr:probable 2-oxoglutarate-dependent dioxygenase AOP1 [Cajanus cajan]
MGSEVTLKLPVIDFTNLKLEANNPNWEEVKSQVHKALVEYGCFEAIFDKVPLDLRKAIFGALQDLFDLPLQTKILNVSKKPYHGYVGQYPMVPLFESMGIDDATIYDKVESMTNILWPDGNQSFSKTIQSFSEQLSELDQIIRKMVLESLGIEKYLEEHMNSTNYLLRVMKYKGPQTSDTKLGLSAHTDKNIVTILYQNQVEGLEVLTKDGKWISYKPSPESFVVMIGDSLHAWSNGRLHSPFHRVMMSGNEARYSTGLFSIPKGGSIIKAPEELVDEEHPLLFKPFDHVEFLKYYYTEKGQADSFALRTYCGV